jgi:hypothetical protein
MITHQEDSLFAKYIYKWVALVMDNESEIISKRFNQLEVTSV